MILRSCPGGVKVSTLPGKPEVSSLIPEPGPCFLFIIVALPRIDLCLDCVKRMYTLARRTGLGLVPYPLSDEPRQNCTLNHTSLCLPMYL